MGPEYHTTEVEGRLAYIRQRSTDLDMPSPRISQIAPDHNKDPPRRESFRFNIPPRPVLHINYIHSSVMFPDQIPP